MYPDPKGSGYFFVSQEAPIGTERRSQVTAGHHRGGGILPFPGFSADIASRILENPPYLRYTNGVVTFEAKTDELAKHYIRDFGAIRVFAKQSGGPVMLMVADNAALSLFSTYLS